MLDFANAFSRVVATAEATSHVESVSLAEAGDKLLAEDQVSSINVPGFANSAMDGYAVRAADVIVDTPYSVSQRIAAGDQPNALAPGSVARIFTGAMLPEGADTIILQENARDDGQHVYFTEPIVAGQNVRPAGQDIARGGLLVSAGDRLNAASLALLASAGISQVCCFKALSIAFFSTGDELCELGEPLVAGQIYNSNRYALRQLLLDLNVIPIDLGFCPDDPAATRAMLLKASSMADGVITTGGMSVGEEDHVLAQARELGEINFWKIAIKPGKPFACGKIGSAAFFGLPGNPVSSFVTFQLLVRPWLLKKMGATDYLHRCVNAVANFDKNNAGKRLDFLRGTLTSTEEGNLQVSLFDNQSSGVMSSLTVSNVLIPLAPHSKINNGALHRVIALTDQALLFAGERWPKTDEV